MPIAVRYTQDAFSRSGWLWPVDAKGEPLKATSYMAVGFYVAKYVNKKSDMDLAAKGLGAKEFIFQAEDGIRDADVTGVQTCALPILSRGRRWPGPARAGAQTDGLRPRYGCGPGSARSTPAPRSRPARADGLRARG